MDYFLKKLANIQKDKLLHFFWGAILSFILMLSFGIFGMFIALIIPAIKELYYDKYLGSMGETYPLPTVVVQDPCMATWVNHVDQIQIVRLNILMLLLCLL